MTEHQNGFSLRKSYHELEPFKEMELGMFVFLFSFMFAFTTYAFNLFGLGNTIYGFIPFLISGTIMMDAVRRS